MFAWHFVQTDRNDKLNQCKHISPRIHITHMAIEVNKIDLKTCSSETCDDKKECSTFGTRMQNTYSCKAVYESNAVSKSLSLHTYSHIINYYFENIRKTTSNWCPDSAVFALLWAWCQRTQEVHISGDKAWLTHLAPGPCSRRWTDHNSRVVPDELGA